MSHGLKNKQQVLRFGIVGAANTLLDFSILLILKSLGLPVISANIISSTTAFVVSFFANKKYTFRGGGESLVREMVLFVIVTLFGLWVIQNSIIHWSLPWFTAQLHNDSLALVAAKVMATAASMVWNYVLYAKVVFRKPVPENLEEN